MNIVNIFWLPLSTRGQIQILKFGLYLRQSFAFHLVYLFIYFIISIIIIIIIIIIIRVVHICAYRDLLKFHNQDNRLYLVS